MPLLKTEIKHDILSIRLRDPQSRNAFSLEMAEALDRAISPGHFKGVVLRGDPPFFCSGGNLQFYKNLKTEVEGLDVNRRIAETLHRVAQLPVPTVAVVDGACYGGGVELLSCFHHVIATPGSLFGLWQRRVGLTFGWGGRERLALKLGEHRCRQWLQSARTITAWQAQTWGLVDAVALRTAAFEKALQYISGLNALGEESLQKILAGNRDTEVFSQLWMQGRHREVLKKF